MLLDLARSVFHRNSRIAYAAPKSHPETEAVAERFLWEVLLTDKWDHLFHNTAFIAEGLKWGPPCDEVPSVFSQGRFPRLLRKDFMVRSVMQRREHAPHAREIRFSSMDKNDHITVEVAIRDGSWTPVGLLIVFLGDARTSENVLVTDWLVVRE